MEITILEDNLFHQVRLEQTIQAIANDLHVSIRCRTTSKVGEFEASLEGDRPHHLYFLDLEINDDREMGFKMAQLVRRHNPYAMIVFVTTLSEYAPETFKYHVSALDFIPKDADNFEERVRECFEHAMSQIQIATHSKEDMLRYSYRGRIELNVPYDDIFFIETTPRSHKLLIQGRHCRNEFYGSLSEIIEMDQGDKGRLTKVSRSAIINLNNVVDYNSKTGEVVFYDSTTYPVSRRYVKQIRNYLAESTKEAETENFSIREKFVSLS